MSLVSGGRDLLRFGQMASYCFSPPCVCIVLRPLSLPQGTTCLNHILGKIIPEMKVLSGLPVHSVFKVQVLTLDH